MSRHFKSGMVQSWNKFCFTGGIFEVDIQFPGRHDVGGLWPAVWLLGNLGRATFESSTNLMWPWSYGECDRTLQSAQEISGCDVTQHYSLISGVDMYICI
jgi:beta-glucanase (GH16 family)